MKYEIDSFQLELLKSKLSSIMNLDTNTGKDGKYEVRSLYFDDMDNSCYFENEDGTDPREKYRIRIYNGDSNRISLECKKKESGKTMKKSCIIPKNQVINVITGSLFDWDDTMDPLVKKLYLLQEMRGMRPKIIVEYDRIPFVYRDGNVRITLDMNIRASTDISNFLDTVAGYRPIMPMKKHLLEVKYDNFLPDFIYSSTALKGLRQVTFSKYYLCRKFGGII